MNKPSAPSTIVSVDLGPLAGHARDIVASGEYPSMDALIQAALAALDESIDRMSEGASDSLADMYDARFEADGRRTCSLDEAFGPVLERLAKQRTAKDAA